MPITLTATGRPQLHLLGCTSRSTFGRCLGTLSSVPSGIVTLLRPCVRLYGPGTPSLLGVATAGVRVLPVVAGGTLLLGVAAAGALVLACACAGARSRERALLLTCWPSGAGVLALMLACAAAGALTLACAGGMVLASCNGGLALDS